MEATGPVIRVEQWSASQAQPSTSDSNCTVRSSGRPSLLETLKAAAQEAAAQGRKSVEQDCNMALGDPHLGSTEATAVNIVVDSDKLPACAPVTQINARAGGMKLNLQPLLLKKVSSKGQKGMAPESPATPASATALGSATTRLVHKARFELAKLEMDIPWKAVHQSWRLQRSHWRKSLKGAESTIDLLTAMRELRDALSIPGSPFYHYGGSWDRLLQHCTSGNANLDDLHQLLNELKANAKAWSKAKDEDPKPAPEIAEDQEALVNRGLEALWYSAQNGFSCLYQCPLEAILDYNEDVLSALRSLMEREIHLQASDTTTGRGSVNVPAGSLFAKFLNDHNSNGQVGSAVSSSRELGGSSC